ncbi:MAG: ABC transporter substrate-binding protein [Deferrisomatales bacterium]|nr:ABC transporter substrate-binding protein [Deferrisomatales bacterium]
MRRWLLAVSSVLLPVIWVATPAVFAGQGDSERDKVRVGELPLLPSIGTFIAMEKGYFGEQGLDIELVMFKIGTQMVPLLASGQLDVGGTGVNAGLYNAISRDGRMRMVADKGHHPYQDSAKPIHAVVISKKLYPGQLTAENLRGQVFSVSGRGNAQEIYLELFLKEHGSSLEEVQVQTMPLPGMLAALSSGAVFGASLLEPFLTLAQSKDLGVPVLANKELYPGQQGGALIYSSAFIAARPEAGVKFMVGYLKGVRDYLDFLDGKLDFDEVFDVVKKHTSMDDRGLFMRIGKPSLHPDGVLNLEGMERDVRWLHQHGYIDATPDMAELVDERFVRKALEVLGRAGQRGPAR